MADAKGRDNWAHTSALLALTANCHRDPKRTRPLKPSDFSPYPERRRRSVGGTEPDRVGLSALMQVLEKSGRIKQQQRA